MGNRIKDDDNYCQKCYEENGEKIECDYTRVYYLSRGTGRRMKKYLVFTCPDCGEEIFLPCDGRIELSIDHQVIHSDSVESEYCERTYQRGFEN